MKVTYFLKNNKFFVNLTIYGIIVYLLMNSSIVLKSLTNSTNIFISKLIPALFPYLLITELLIQSGKIDDIAFGLSKILSKIFHVPTVATPCIIIGFLLGYPNAAKYVGKLYNNNKINYYSALHLVSFTNNANISYIIATLGISIFGNINIGIILTISHFLSAILMGIFFISPYNNSIIQQKKANSNSFNKIYSPFELLYASIYNSLKTLAYIFSYMAIFSLIPAVIFNTFKLPETCYSLIMGVFEISNGINSVANLSINLNFKLILTSFILSFSSLMVLIQVFSFVRQTGIKFKQIIIFKLIQGLISSILTYVIITYIYTPTSVVFSNIDIIEIANNQLLPSTVYMFSLMILTILTIIIFRKKRQD